MYILGISGGLNSPGNCLYELPFISHDSAAVLLKDGEVAAAIEEERLNRIKHTNCFPEKAVRFCLEYCGIQIEDVDVIAYYFSEGYIDYIIRHQAVERQKSIEFEGISKEIDRRFRAFTGKSVAHRLKFIDHHRAHAASSFYMSGFEESLVLVLDGMGEHVSISIYHAGRDGLTLKASYGQKHSLGIFYLTVCNLLGYRLFEEYKVMALASCGSRETYRTLFSRFYTLLPGGNFELNPGLAEIAVGGLLGAYPDEKVSDMIKKDVAAALQEALEKIVIHILKGIQEKEPYKNLCMAGGVALNCSMNGKILSEGLFENIFVQPASHDGGGALGAALEAYRSACAPCRAKKLEHVYWGTEISGDEAIIKQLKPWTGIISVEYRENVEEAAAACLYEGSIIGWVQGRSEYGPRALGNRSILADPRPVENKTRINSIIKEREGFRPFAPMIAEDYLDTYFHVPASQCRSFPFMLFVLKVREQYRKALGAVTHVDGTARVQTVNRQSGLRNMQLLEAFKELSGIPILLNTSFNNNSEPIVDSALDALITFCTSELDLLFINNLMIRKTAEIRQKINDLVLTVPCYTRIYETIEGTGQCPGQPCNYITSVYNSGKPHKIPEAMYWILGSGNGRKSFGELMDELGIMDWREREALAGQAYVLWQKRLIGFTPVK